MVTDVPVDDLEERIRAMLDAACQKDIRIATAESCTGGLLSAMITDIDGVSHAFERGFVTYSETAKAEQLGIQRDMIEREGAVSESVARAMAEGALAHSDAHVAIAITGFAGPAKGDAEEGLVHFACASDTHPTRHVERHFGSIGRDAIRAAALDIAVRMLAAAIDTTPD